MLYGNDSDTNSVVVGGVVEVETSHDKTYSKTCTTSEDSDQSAHPRKLITVFADRMCLLQPPGYPKRDTKTTIMKTRLFNYIENFTTKK